MSQTLLRVRDGHGASVSFSELLFDLIYVFAVTQLSHYLLHHLTLTGAVESCCCGSPFGWPGNTLPGSPTGLTRIPVLSVFCCLALCCWACSLLLLCHRPLANGG